MRTLRSIAIALLAAIAASLLMLSGAMAHAGLIASAPADGAVRPTAPAELTLTFTEPVSPIAFTLVSPDGQRRDIAGAVSENETVRLPLPEGLVRGTHLVSWRVVSADGHPIAGSLVFSVGEIGVQTAPAAGTDPTLARSIWLVRAALYATLFFGVGGAVFGRLVAPLPGPLPRFNLALCGAGLVLTPVALDLQGLDALGLGLVDLLSPAPWVAGFSTSYGITCVVAAVAFLAAALSVRIGREPLRSGLVALAWIAAALAPSLSGHAGTAPPAWLSKPAVVLHIGGLVFWIGALLPLGWLLRSDSEPARSGLKRFSRLIPVAIVPIVASGIVLAALQMGIPGPAWQSPYAILLAAKLMLLVPLFGLALWNRVALTGPALAGAATAHRRLQRSAALELLLVMLIFGVVAGWRFTPPPRVIAEIAAQPAEIHIHTAPAMADVTVTPGHAGEVTMRIWLADGEFGALVPKALAVSLSSPALGIEELRRNATLGTDGYWTVPLLLPVGGTWSVELAIRVDDFKLVKLTGELELAP